MTPRTATGLPVRVFQPGPSATGAPLVLVHGNSRRAGAMLHAFLPTAMDLGIPLVVPRFGLPTYDGYQRLRGADGPTAAADAFTRTLDLLVEDGVLPGGPVNLLGFSGGAQFVHRYAMTRPTRVGRLVAVSAGWYTRVDADRAFPRGTAATDGVPAVDVDAFLRIPLLVAVGEKDVEADAGLRTTPSLVRQQGADRLARALSWADHLEHVAETRGVRADVRFALLPRTGHSWSEAVGVGGLVPTAMEFLLEGDAR